MNVDLPDALIDEIVARVTERVLAQLAAATPRGDRLLQISQAAKQLGMTEAALRKHVARGNLAAVRIGGRILINMEALQ